MDKQAEEERRHRRRIKHVEKVKLKADELFHQAFFEPCTINSDEVFIEVWEKFEASLLNTFGQQKDFRQAFKRGEHLLRHCQKQFNRPYFPPTTIVTNREPKQTRDSQWLSYSWAIYDSYEAWRQNLSTDTSDPNLRYQSLLLSLIFESGQFNIDVIEAFNKKIAQSEPLLLSRFSCYTCLPLILDNGNINTNTDIDDDRVTEYQCYLSIHTLAQLHLWNKTSKNQWEAPVRPDLIYKRLIDNFSSSDNLPSKFRAFCRCAASWYERNRNSHISQALIEFRTGRTSSYSLPSKNLQQIIQPQVSMPKATSFGDFHLQIDLPRATPHERTINLINNANLASFYSIMRAPFKMTSGQKLSPTELSTALRSITEIYPLENWQSCFIGWLQLKLLSCQPSTINSYKNTLLKDWVYMNTEHSLTHDLTPVELEEVYQQQIDRRKSEKSRKNFSARLKDLHSFAYSYLTLPTLGDEFFHHDATQEHTRAGIIDEVLFRALLEHIHSLTDINTLDKLALQSICILSYRCGLRMNELYKIQMRNISHCDEIWIDIRPNEFGDNKTASSLRRLPILPLLLNDEKAIFDSYLQHKRSTTKNRASPFLTIGENTTKPFDKSAVSNYVGSFLRVASGLEHFVFYHLRHSCLSRLQVMLELPSPSEVLPHFYPYDKKQHDDIRTLLFKNSSLKGYWEIAAFAGHEDPTVTFAHYFHLSDLLAAPQKTEYLKPIDSSDAIKSGVFTHDRYWMMHKKHQQKVILAHGLKPLFKKLNVKALVSNSAIHINASTTSLIPKPQDTLSIELCYQVLDAIACGHSIDNMAFEYRLNSEIIEQWFTNAQYIKSLRVTSANANSNQSRIFSKNRQHSLAPGRLKTQKEKEYAQKFNIKLRPHYRAHREQFIEQMKYCLHHCSVSHSGVYFNHPDKLLHFLEAFKFAIPNSHWRVVTYYMASSSLKEEWMLACKGLKVITEEEGKTTGRSGHGSVRLELISPNEKNILDKKHLSKYSSHLLTYLMFFTFVMVTKM